MAKEDLILTITEHPNFGWRMNLYSADTGRGMNFVLSGMPEAGADLSETLNALMREVEKISEKSLLKAFSKDKDKTGIPPSTMENYVRPYIEKICVRITELAGAENIPFFFRADASKPVSERNRVALQPEPSRCLFNFIKDKKGLRYFISLSNGDEELSLQRKPVVVLSNEPCLVLLGDRIHRIDDIDAKKLSPFFSKTHIDIPAAAENDYIRKFVLKTIPKYEVRIEGIEMKEINAAKKAILVLEEDFHSRPVLSLLFDYNGRRFKPTTNPKKKKVVVQETLNGRETICSFSRDFEWENGCVARLLGAGLTKEYDTWFCLDRATHGQYGLIAFLNKHESELSDFAMERRTGKIYYVGPVETKAGMSEKIDWFDMQIEVVFDNFAIPFARFRRHILTDSREYVLPDGRVFILPEQWFVDCRALFMHGESSDSGIKLNKMHIGVLNGATELLGLPDDNPAERFRRMSDNLPAPPESLEHILRPYQKEGFRWLTHLGQHNFGACLADDMGLGKTIQTITLLEHIYSGARGDSSCIPASLIVAPTSLLHNWKNELQKFAPALRAYLYAGNKRFKSKAVGRIFDDHDVVITSYGIVRSDIEILCCHEFHYIVLDESQYIKNPDSAVCKSVVRLNSSHRIALTGTPIENSLTDLWAQFNFMNPGMLGNLSWFKENYAGKIGKDKDEEAEKRLSKLIRPFMLRRTKEEVTPELPPLLQEIVCCDMSEEQELLYLDEKNRIRRQLVENSESFLRNNFVALQSLMRLRLLANHPALADTSYAGDSGKFEQILLCFENVRAGGHKALIFSSFVKLLKLLAGIFDERGWKYAMLTGSTVDREGEIAKFSDSDTSCFFISLKAGGTGLNLTEADYVFIVDPWWNPAAEMQALSRAHRIGQKKNVMVYRFISNDSVEEKILRLQNEKLRLSETFVTSNNPLFDLNDSEIEKLFF
ncbi:MAG: DEAD/DEAH box helicase [Prevotellaceae bacterium]|jgi:superfamily II DNA or RNA helicase|nr:DEAD/DEAH box helicase [Prevotellaceae bacterium]